jgi:hypothetical protein
MKKNLWIFVCGLVALLTAAQPLWAGGNPWLDVSDYGGNLQNTISALPTAGGTVLIPPNYTVNLTSGVTTGSKIVHIYCADWTSIIAGSGFALITLQSKGSSVENCQILDPTGNAYTIGIDINNGAAGVIYAKIKNCNIWSEGSTAMGKGIHGYFALKGEISNNIIGNFNYGLEFEGDSTHGCNSNDIHGNQFEGAGTADIYISPNAASDVSLTDNTIEGLTGVGLISYAGVVTSRGNHYEAPIGVELFNGTYSFSSTGDFYFSQGTNSDVVVESGNTPPSVTLIAGYFEKGITNNSPAPISMIAPGYLASTSGNFIYQYSANSLSGPSGTSLYISGYQSIVAPMPLFNNSGSLTIEGSGNGPSALIRGLFNTGDLLHVNDRSDNTVLAVDNRGGLNLGAGTGGLRIRDQGSCTMSFGACPAQTLGHTYASPPNCIAAWNGSGTLTGRLKVPSTTTTVTPNSTTNTDTAQVNWVCFGN